TATESSDTSGRLITMIIRIFHSDFDSLSASQHFTIIESFQFVVRKAAHFTAYAILGIFSFFTYITYIKIPLKIRLILIPLTCLLYSISDEIH
ncbi:VanZ family protein, partial [Methylobacterium sp. C33D]